MAIKRRRGTPGDAALLQPFIGPALPRMPGLPFGTQVQTRDPFNWDPWWMHWLGIVNSSVYLFTGNKGQGKSAAQKVIALRFGARRGRDLGDGQIHPMRMLFNDRKLEGEEPEFAKLVRYLQGTIVPLSNFAGINIFDPKMGMEEKDLVETAVNVVEMVTNVSPLPRFQGLALQVGVWKMLADRPDEASPELLQAKLYGLDIKDVEDYMQAKNDAYQRLNLQADLFRHDASQVASSLGEVLHGSYGGIFGGKHSLHEVLTEPVVLLDWTGVSDKSRTLLSAMLWKWRGIAQRRGDQLMIPDMIFSDEEHQAVNNLMYVRFMSASLKEVRSQPTAYFLSTQHETDLAMAGEPDSEIRNLSESIANSVGGRFISRQPDKKEILDFYRNLGFSEFDVRALPVLPRGQFYFHASGYPPVSFRLELTEIERALTDTASAVRSMTVGANRSVLDGDSPDMVLARKLLAGKGTS